MRKNEELLRTFIFWVALMGSSLTIAQERTTATFEKPPVFPECKNQPIDSLKSCFQFRLNTFIYENFKVPEIVATESYRGSVEVLFEVDKTGDFKVIFIDAIYEELKQETERLFNALPQIEPATYNGNPTFTQYSIKIKIPLVNPEEQRRIETMASERDATTPALVSNEIDSINQAMKPYDNLEYKSQLNIPFTHSYYARFDRVMNFQEPIVTPLQNLLFMRRWPIIMILKPKKRACLSIKRVGLVENLE